MIRFLLFFILINHSFAAVTKGARTTQYKTYFGQCPSKVAGKLTLRLMKVFDKRKSLFDIKEAIINNKLDEKHFLSSYKVNYDPELELLSFNFDCPRPLAKVQIYKENGDEFYTAILVDTGKFVDPTYEMLLRTEKRLSHHLPNLAYPVELIEDEVLNKLTGIMSTKNKNIIPNLSEVIVDEKRNLTMIFSIKKRASSVFMGRDMWDKKLNKLTKVLGHMTEKGTIPSVINLTNHKKVVVKFPDKI